MHLSVRFHTPLLLLLLNVVLIPACKGDRSFLRFLWANYPKLIIWLAIDVAGNASCAQGRRHDVSMGGGRGGFRLEWTDSGESKLSTPKFGFLLEFRPLYFVNTYWKI